MLNKINAFLRKIIIPLNIVNILMGLVMSIAYVYIPFTSIIGLVLGIFMAISGSATIGISYYFTAKNSQSQEATQNSEPPNKEKVVLENTKASYIFLGIAIPMILLNSAASYFGMFTGIILLAGALAIPLAPPAIITIAVVAAIILAIGTLINSWLQTHNIWESLKKPVPIKASITKEEIKPSLKIRKHKKDLNLISCFKKNIHLKTQRVSHYIGSLFVSQREKGDVPKPIPITRTSSAPSLLQKNYSRR